MGEKGAMGEMEKAKGEGAAAGATGPEGSGAIGEADIATSRELVEFIQACPSMFHTTAAIRERLDAAGFEYLPEGGPWHAAPGSRCYTVRNNSSIVAFKVGAQLPADSYHFQITAAHGDSPTFKVKAAAELDGPGEYLRLNTEVYGGAIDYTWFDKPLSIAGRVLVREGARIESRLYESPRPVAIIPSLAIHLNRQVNDGFAPNRQVDLMPLASAGRLRRGAFDAMVAADMGVAPELIVGRDLFLVNGQAPQLWGWRDEFVSTPKLDDLMCAFASLKAFLSADNERCVMAFACFDNEEVGSNTKQGAMSTFLRDALSRLNAALGRAQDDYHRALSKSMLVSCDNAHALHPNHPEKYDEGNRAMLNRGIVVKEAANQKYCTDAFSRAVFCAVCDDAGVPYQLFANRSDMAGGSTLGNLSNTQASMHAVDVGCPQLAMHSAYETTGVRDARLAIDALAAFFAADIRIDGADAAALG